MSMFYELMMKKKGMPSRYQEVEYIESTGTQYIDTQIAKTTNIKTKITIQSNDTSSSHIILSYCSGGGQWFGTSGQYYGVGSSSGQISTILANSKQTIDITTLYHESITAIFENNESVTRNYVSEGTQSYDTYRLVGGIAVAYFSSCKVYSCEIRDYDNNRLLRNYIPVYDTLTQKYGMWESVERKFYGNDGTGDFAGA